MTEQEIIDRLVTLPRPTEQEAEYRIEAELNDLKDLMIEQYRAGQAEALPNFITKTFGRRHQPKDIEDFPDLKHDERCLTCLIWEAYDEEQDG